MEFSISGIGTGIKDGATWGGQNGYGVLGIIFLILFIGLVFLQLGRGIRGNKN